MRTLASSIALENSFSCNKCLEEKLTLIALINLLTMIGAINDSSEIKIQLVQ